uniref:Uncharacterized protein n=1 Tax=Parascaris equorum TaxID=6256 RepID=A0A914RFD4_PAREQ
MRDSLHEIEIFRLELTFVFLRNMDTISMDDVNGESTNKAKDSESAQSAVSARNVSTSTPLIWEDTLPAEVTAVDPFATTVPSLLLSSTTLGTSTMQANVVTDETLLISHERTVDVIVTTVSPVSTLSTDGDLSTREEGIKQFHSVSDTKAPPVTPSFL